MKKELLVKNTPLHKEDRIDKTYGCRHSNYDICSNYCLTDKCAFCTKDNICYCPPKSWKKQYIKLGGK